MTDAKYIKKLQQLLLELYVSGSVDISSDNLSNAADGERDRLLDTVLAAAEGRPFALLDLPFPRAKA